MAVKASEWDRDRPEPPRLQVREPTPRADSEAVQDLMLTAALWEAAGGAAQVVETFFPDGGGIDRRWKLPRWLDDMAHVAGELIKDKPRRVLCVTPDGRPRRHGYAHRVFLMQQDSEPGGPVYLPEIMVSISDRPGGDWGHRWVWPLGLTLWEVEDA